MRPLTNHGADDAIDFAPDADLAAHIRAHLPRTRRRTDDATADALHELEQVMREEGIG